MKANAFAAALLLPAAAFGADVSIYPNRLSHYVELKQKWHVSAMAMIMRAYSLGYISSNQYSYLMRQMSMNGYRQKEPLDDAIEYKHPVALKQAINLLMSKGNMTSQDIIALFAANKFSVSPDVVEELLDLEVGTLTKYKEPPKIIEFPAIQKAEE